MSSSTIICTFMHFFALSVATHHSHYCDLCDEPGTHTMCLYPTDDLGPNCTSHSRSTLTRAEKESVITMHNIFRSRVAIGETKLPKAADMLQLSWDDELEIVAQRWMNQCKFEHDKCRESERFAVGQNIGISSSSDDTGHSNHVGIILRLWYSEIKKFNPSHVEVFEGDPNTGHLTQMIWSRSYLIGCGRVNFTEGGMKGEMIACNYGPAGNVIGGFVYYTGRPCSACPNGTSCSTEYRGLCSYTSHHFPSIQLGIMLQAFVQIIM